MRSFLLRRRFLLAAALASAAAGARAQTGLGLAERRALAAYREGTYPALLAEIRRAAGFDVEVEVQWDRIAIPGGAANYADADYWTNVYFRPLIAALTSVASDAMGKEAIRAKLRRVVVTYEAATAPASNYPNGLRFADGTFTINFQPFTNASDLRDRTAAMVKVLEDNL